ncbi:MAG: MBL fold metallo-hydrolase [Caldisericum sp.]|jgi:glyoxylase-like metal-dependent hydrolase (beta-lactamase superfamily II)|uniref:MBL fold metallo-hydrolase n=1 Tax=Caldisericum sp. TaxID=2499687 RepID=UPI003D0F3D5B
MEKIKVKGIEILKFVFNPLSTNCYLINANGYSIVIDPSNMSDYETEALVHEIRNPNLYIFNTHGHFDHIVGNGILKKFYANSKIVIHKNDSEMLLDPNKNKSYIAGIEIISPPPDIEIEEETEYLICGINLKIIHTPGHTKGSISIIGDNFVFTGDTLLQETVGIAKDYQNAFNELIDSIKNKLLILNDEFIVLPGHGEITKIGDERAFNPFLN